MRVAIVGKGPSIERSEARFIGLAHCEAVITLNQAIVKMRETMRLLGIRYIPTFTMQKDGCEPHTGFEFTGNAREAGHDCGVGRMVAPQDGETLIVSKYESANCFSDYPQRIVLDAQPWYQMSITLATQFAIGDLGADAIDFYCMDSYTRGDSRTWMPDGIVDLGESYLPGAEAANRLCAQAGINVRWVTP